MNANQILQKLLSLEVSNEEKSALLCDLKPELISVENLDYFRSRILSQCIKIDLENIQTIDICGTGGDGKDTINISTLSSFLISACGYKVAKHGNFGFSSKCGSSDILIALGVKLPKTPSEVIEQIQKFGLAFIHAPYFHPGLKNLGPIRKAIKLKTIFNILGPLCNPANPSASFLGVSDYRTLRLYKSVLQKTNLKFLIGYDQDGYDECSLTNRFYQTTNNSEDYFDPIDIGLKNYSAVDLLADNDLTKRKDEFIKILSGKSTSAHTDIVAVNAALAISIVDKSNKLDEIFNHCKQILLSGGALSKLESLVN